MNVYCCRHPNNTFKLTPNADAFDVVVRSFGKFNKVIKFTGRVGCGLTLPLCGYFNLKKERVAMKNLNIFFLVLVFLAISSCVEKVDIEAEKASIQPVLDQYANAWKALDIDKFSKIFSHDEDLMIFDTQNRFDGWEAWKERLEKSFDLIKDVKVTFRDYSIIVHPSGKIAWLSTLEDAAWISQDQPDELNGIRVTWVLEKREGRWVIVQGHWSVSENEEAE